MDTSFTDDLNADSVDIVDLSMALEEEFGIDELDEEQQMLCTLLSNLLSGTVYFIPSLISLSLH